MPPYVRVGDPPHKRHSVVQGPSGRLAEELMGQIGFSGASSLLYHSHSPSALLGVEEVRIDRCSMEPNGALEPYHLRLGELDAGSDPVTGRRALLGNQDVTLCWVSSRSSSDLYRNAAGDELVYVFSGSGELESVFGTLRFSEGDYIVIPASTTHRWSIEPGGSAELLVLEARGHIGIPPRYLTETGQLKEGAPFSERDLRAPEGPLVREDEGVPVLVEAPVRLGPARPREPPFRRRRLGRVRLPVRILYPGLRADRRTGAPAATGPPDLRRARVRRLQLRPPSSRLRRGAGLYSVSPRQHRLGRGSLLRRRGLHEPIGHRHRREVDNAASGRIRARAATR